MKVLIKNVQLQKQYPKLKTLETASEQTLRTIAKDYQIGFQKRVKFSKEVEYHGERKKQTSYKFVPRTKTELIKEIRDRTKISVDIPRELWTDEQYEAFMDEGILDNMDITAELDFKKGIGVYKDLLPYEDLPRHKQDSMFIETDMNVWGTLNEEFNYKNDVDKNKLQVKRWRPLLYPYEFIAETDEEKETVEKMNAAIKAIKGGDLLKLNKAMEIEGQSGIQKEESE